MFLLTDEEKERIANGEDIYTIIAERLSAPANVNTDTPEETAIKRSNEEQKMIDYRPLPQVVGNPAEEIDETDKNVTKVENPLYDDKRHILTPEQLKAKYEADMIDYNKDDEEATELMKNYGYEDPIKKNIKENVALEMAKSKANPSQEPDLTDYSVPSGQDDGPSIWSKLADFISNMKILKKPGTAMSGWTLYNGSPSQVAAAYNNWLQGEKSREAQAAQSVFNAINNQKLAEINAKNVADAEAKGLVKERKDKNETSFRNDVLPIIGEMRTLEREYKEADDTIKNLIGEDGKLKDVSKQSEYDDAVNIRKNILGRLQDSAAQVKDLADSYDDVELTTGQKLLISPYLNKTNEQITSSVQDNKKEDVQTDTVAETDDTNSTVLNDLNAFIETGVTDSSTINGTKANIKSINEQIKSLSDKTVSESMNATQLSNTKHKLEEMLQKQKNILNMQQKTRAAKELSDAKKWVETNKMLLDNDILKSQNKGYQKWLNKEKNKGKSFIEYFYAMGGTDDELINAYKRHKKLEEEGK